VGHAASSNTVSELKQRMFAQIEWGHLASGRKLLELSTGYRVTIHMSLIGLWLRLSRAMVRQKAE
jgi:hypothetical protein